MNTEALSRGWALIAEGAEMISMAYASIESPATRAGVSERPTSAAGAPPASAAPDQQDEPPLKPQVAAGLGKCPVHGKPWTVKPAGVGKNGPYDAFWRCDERDEDGYCKQKPQKIWRDTHPIREGAAA